MTSGRPRALTTTTGIPRNVKELTSSASVAPSSRSRLTMAQSQCTVRVGFTASLSNPPESMIVHLGKSTRNRRAIAPRTRSLRREIGGVRGCLSGAGLARPSDGGEIKVSGLRRQRCAQDAELLIRAALILDNHVAHRPPKRILEDDVGRWVDIEPLLLVRRVSGHKIGRNNYLSTRGAESSAMQTKTIAVVFLSSSGSLQGTRMSGYSKVIVRSPRQLTRVCMVAPL